MVSRTVLASPANPSSTSATFSYDATNRLVGYSNSTDSISASYLYNPNNQRIKKTVNGSSIWYLYDNQRLLAEFNNSGTLNKRYAYLPGAMAPIQMTDSNGTYQIHNDHLATPKLLTNSSEVVVWKAEHQAFGKAVVDEDPDNNSSDVTLNIRYPGQYFDAETGLHYNWHRTYDPNTGRYLQRDLIGLADGPNPYTYVSQNPINAWDFTGLYNPGGDQGIPEWLPPGWCFSAPGDGSASMGPCDQPPPEEPPKKKCPECPKPPELNDPPPDAPHTEPPVKTKSNPNDSNTVSDGGDGDEERPFIAPEKPKLPPTSVTDVIQMCSSKTNCAECMSCCATSASANKAVGYAAGACYAECQWNLGSTGSCARPDN